jgi:hypothetical protein
MQPLDGRAWIRSQNRNIRNGRIVIVLFEAAIIRVVGSLKPILWSQFLNFFDSCMAVMGHWSGLISLCKTIEGEILGQ